MSVKYDDINFDPDVIWYVGSMAMSDLQIDYHGHRYEQEDIGTETQFLLVRKN